MQDRVADVLAQRAALDHNLLAGVLLSIFLHGTFVAAAIYAAMHTAAPKIANVINIKLAPMRAPAAAPRAIEPAAPPKPATPRIESPKPEPVKPVETKKPPEKNTVPLSPFGRSEKKGSENPSTRKPVNPSTSTQSVAPVTPGVSAGTIEGADFPYTIYIDRMTNLVASHFFRPQSAGTPLVVVFTIDRDGAIRDAAIETHSNNAAWDRAAERAVLESSPLPPLPFGYGGTFIRVHLTFR